LYAYVENDPVSQVDPLGLFPWKVGNGGILGNFGSGIFDGLMPFGDDIRKAVGADLGVDECSRLYGLGQGVGLIASLGRLGYAGAAKGISMWPGISGSAAVGARNLLKGRFRGGMGGDFRMYSYEQVLASKGSEAAAVRSAGRTNNYLNGWAAANLTSSLAGRQCGC
jgi:hypothetical protein